MATSVNILELRPAQTISRARLPSGLASDASGRPQARCRGRPPADPPRRGRLRLQARSSRPGYDAAVSGSGGRLARRRPRRTGDRHAADDFDPIEMDPDAASNRLLCAVHPGERRKQQARLPSPCAVANRTFAPFGLANVANSRLGCRRRPPSQNELAPFDPNVANGMLRRRHRPLSQTDLCAVRPSERRRRQARRRHRSRRKPGLCAIWAAGTWQSAGSVAVAVSYRKPDLCAVRRSERRWRRARSPSRSAVANRPLRSPSRTTISCVKRPMRSLSRARMTMP